MSLYYPKITVSIQESYETHTERWGNGPLHVLVSYR
jgi:hypothetical protein